MNVEDVISQADRTPGATLTRRENRMENEDTTLLGVAEVYCRREGELSQRHLDESRAERK